MSKSAKSTDHPYKRLTQICSKTLLVGLLVSVPNTPSVEAQEGDVSFRATPPIATSETIRSIRDAVTPAIPEGAIAPQVIVKTFLATAYCLKGQTASGITVRRGIIAADPKILPLGSVVRHQAGNYSGIYTVMDTGGAIRGQRIDIYLPTRAEAIRFGARKVKLEVLRRGWEPSTGDPEAAR